MTVAQEMARKKRKLVILIVVLILCIGLAAFFAVSLALEISSIQEGQSYYSNLAIDFEPRSNHQTTVNETHVEEMPSDSIKDHVPFIEFDSVGETIPDIVAWIQSDATVINYPVVRGTDNDFYLSHLPDKTKNKAGSIFLDYRNMTDFSDKNILIYGHNMSSGDMFGSLKNYSDQSYFEQHYSMFLFTPTADYELLLYAGYVLDSAYEVPPMYFDDLADFDRYIADVSKRSIFKSDVEVNFGDQLIFLCTCTPSSSKDERLILVCKLAIK